MNCSLLVKVFFNFENTCVISFAPLYPLGWLLALGEFSSCWLLSLLVFFIKGCPFSVVIQCNCGQTDNILVSSV